MQPFQPLFSNMNFERCFPTPDPISQYAQSPQPFVLGEGDIACVVNPNGVYSFFFVPTMKPWLTISFNPNLPSYVHPYWYTDTGVWIVRSISNPIPWNMFLQMVQKYSNCVGELSNSINLRCPTSCNSQLPLPESSLMETQQFHNDCVTSTTDLHYFFPRPNISVNTLRLPCDCHENNGMDHFRQFCAVGNVNEMGIPQQFDLQKRNGLHVTPQFSLPQPVVCNRPCYCVPPANSNNQNPMNAFSFRQPYQTTGATGCEPMCVQGNDNAIKSCTCVPERPYLPCLCRSNRKARKSDNLESTCCKSRSKHISSDTSCDDKQSKNNKAKICKKCANETENIVKCVKNKIARSLSQGSYCKYAEEDKNEKDKHSTNSKSNHCGQKNMEYEIYSNSSFCDDETCTGHKSKKKKTCNKNTCPAHINKPRESISNCDTNLEGIDNIKESDYLSCNNETCSARKNKSKISNCTNETCPVKVKKTKESICLPPLTSCDKESCPVQNKSKQSTSARSNKSCPAKKNKNQPPCNPELCCIKTVISQESFNSMDYFQDVSSKESSSTCDIDTCHEKKQSCNNDTCPAHIKKKNPSCDNMCPKKKEELLCADLCPNKVKVPLCVEVTSKVKSKPSCPKNCAQKELKHPYECPEKEDKSLINSKKCIAKSYRASKKGDLDSEDSQIIEEVCSVHYLDRANSHSSKEDCYDENCPSRLCEKENKSKIDAIYRKDTKKCCSDCSACSSSNQTAKKAPFSWRSFMVPSRRVSKAKKSHSSNLCCKSTNINHSDCATACKSCSARIKQPIKQCDNAIQENLSNGSMRKAGKKYKPRICSNMGPRFLIGKRRKADPNCCSCSTNTFYCTSSLKETSTDACKTTVDKYIATYNDTSTDCPKVNATQTKRCICRPRCHKKHYVVRTCNKDYVAEMWTPKINCDFDCHQFLLDLRGSVPCLYNKNI